VPALLEIRDLAVHYAAGHGAPVVAVDEVSADVEEGETVGLLGESGCGKTTLLLAVLGLLPAGARVVRGSIRFRGRELLAMEERERRSLRGAQIAMIFQEPILALNPVRRVGSQIGEVLLAHRDWGRRRRREEATAMLAEVGFAEPARLYEAYPHELSGGQRQRVAIAQALACRPALVLADEPAASLDSTTQADLRALLRALQARFGLALLLVSHDLAALATLARRLLVMYAGRVVEAGTPAQVFGEPLHPYSRGLLRAWPRAIDAATRARVRPVPIEGSPPDLGRLPAGCAFEPRCPDRAPVCAERPPREVRPADDRRVRCFNYGG
jgi:peptide/nickel transport system ATP-binding protein/oligopeptide transport system ATP-binding protein